MGLPLRKVVIIGNSVAQRTRPHVPGRSRSYGELLQRRLNATTPEQWIVENRAFSRATLYDIERKRHELIATLADVYLLHIGVCDAATREVPRWFSDLMAGSPRNPLAHLASWFHHRIVKPRRSTFVRLRGYRPWLDEATFARKYRELVTLLQHHTAGRFLAIGILPANARVERELPGSAARYLRYNAIIREIAAEFGFSYVDVEDLDSAVHYPDGTHLSEAGQAVVMERVVRLVGAAV